MDITTLVNITSRAWSLTILSLIWSGTAARPAQLLAASGASRSAFSESFQHLIDLGLLERNPGHGHPLRPEYRLTPPGEIAAAAAHRILGGADAPQLPLLRRAWTVPVLGALHKPRRFGEIRTTLPKITDRALSQSLQALERIAWVERSIDQAERPARPWYAAMNAGARISQEISVISKRV